MTKTQQEKEPGYLECLEHKDDIQRALTAVTPPFDNYYNISRAIYPSVHVPSLYVRIWIQFYNRSFPTNYSSVGQPVEFTWSKSCLYVAVRFISLYAMNIYSLFAIWPNRRQQDLKMTMLKFCKNVNTKERDATTAYFLSTLEDVAAIPEVKDPRLNTVECVVKGHDRVRSQHRIQLRGSKAWTDYLCWIILVNSLIAAFVFSRMIMPWLQDGENLKGRLEEEEQEEQEEREEDRDTTPETDTKKAAKQEHIIQTYAIRFLIVNMLFLFELSLAASPVLRVIREVIQTGRGRVYSYPIIYFLFPCGCAILCMCRCLAKCHFSTHINAIECCTFWMTVEEVIIFCTFFMSTHHLLWILLGVITEPSWAVPVLVVVCSVCFAIYALAYSNQKAFHGTRCHKPSAFISGFLVIILILQFLVFGVAGEVFLSTDPIAGIISSILVFVVSLWLNYFKSAVCRYSPDKPIGQKPPQEAALAEASSPKKVTAWFSTTERPQSVPKKV